MKVMNVYNNAVHNVTKYSPYEVFYSKDENLYKKVYDNIPNYYSIIEFY